MKRIIFSVFILIAFNGFSQTDVDALRYSITNFGGTARGMGVAGAFGALGGDLTSATINPAGIGIYRSSELVLTPALFNVWNKSNFLDTKDKEFRYSFNFSNFGLAGSFEQSGSNWKRINYSVGYNRINDFHRKVFFHGYNTQNSMLDRFAELASGSNPNDLSAAYPFNAGLAYETYLINPIPTDTTNYSSVIPNGNIEQLQKSNIRGKIDEWFFNAAANYNEKLFIGATIGLPFLKYQEETTFEEIDFNDSIPDFYSFSVTNNLKTQGYGINLKLGLIYKVNDYVRLGGAIHTPTVFYLEDSYSSFMISDFDTFGTYEWSSPEGNYKYKLLTPMKLIGSLAILSKNYGFISIDYEWLDYGQALFDFNSANIKEEIIESGINEAIDEKYQPVSNIRIGAEGKMDIYRLRVGYAIYDSPLHPSIVTDGGDLKRTSISFGAGIREKEYFIDLAYVRTTSKEYFSPYDLEATVTPGVLNEITQNNILLTMGLKF